MANSNRPSGLAPVRYLNGATWNQQATVYYIPSTDNNAFAIGDPVTIAGSGSANGIATVTLATAGTGSPVTGVLVGMGGTVEGAMYGDPANLNTIVIPATKAQGYYVAIVDDPMVIFEIQESATSGTPLAATDIGSNANLVSGANNGYVSGWMMNNNTLAVTSTLQLRILGLSQRNDNAFGAFAKWLVKINNHSYAAGVAGV